MSRKLGVGSVLLAILGIVLVVPAQEPTKSPGDPAPANPVLMKISDDEPEALPPSPAPLAMPSLPPARGGGGWRAAGSGGVPVLPIREPATVQAVAAQGDAEGVPAGSVPSIAPGARRRTPVPALTPPEAASPPAAELGPITESESEPMPTPAAPAGKSILKRPAGTPIPAPAADDSPRTAALPAPPAARPAPLPIPREEVESPSDKSSSRRLPRVTVGGGEAPEAPLAKGPVGSIREMTFRSVSPQLRLETRGPQAINIGKEAKYYVDIFNEGDAAAPEIQVRVLLPGSVNLEKVGDGANVQPEAGGRRVLWTIPGIEARARKTLELRLVATEGKPIELAVDWAFRPNGHKAQIAVRQPQLQVAVTGPGEIGFGEERPFRVTVSNSGTGDAEAVIVTAGATGNRAQKFDVGVLAAGQSKEFTATFVANQPGEMDVEVTAVGEADLQAESAARVLIRRAELAMTLDGPPLKYSGAQASYAIEISNTGNAAANEVQMSLTLPAGAKYVSGLEGAVQTGTVLKWRAGQVPAGNSRVFEFNLQLAGAGENRFEVQARGTGAGVAAAAQFVTQVEALADLKLVVNDPAGPFPAGSEVAYEVQVLNRGSNAAKQIKIVMHFSEGIEPTGVEGGQGRLLPGQVIFEPLAQLEAGEKVALKVKAKGESAGNHLFRVEAICTEPETRLVSEGTTRFITDTTGGTRVSRKPGPPGALPKR